LKIDRHIIATFNGELKFRLRIFLLGGNAYTGEAVLFEENPGIISMIDTIADGQLDMVCFTRNDIRPGYQGFGKGVVLDKILGIIDNTGNYRTLPGNYRDCRN